MLNEELVPHHGYVLKIVACHTMASLKGRFESYTADRQREREKEAAR